MPYDTAGTFVSMSDALDAWEPFAIALLIDTAKKYNGFVTYKQLGDTVQGRSGIRHDGLLTNWIGSLLGRVIDHCVQEQVPQLRLADQDQLQDLVLVGVDVRQHAQVL